MGRRDFKDLELSSQAEARPYVPRGRTLLSTGRNAEIIRSFPWAVTRLGPMEDWDANLVVNLDMVLDARFPMFLCWGRDLHLLYNSAFEIALVGKGECSGRPVSEVFSEIWSDLRGFFDAALEGHASYLEDFPLTLVRNDKPEFTWWSLSYSPVRAEDNSIQGVLAVVYETTRRVSLEAAFRMREAELVAITEAAPNLMWRCDCEGVLTWANPALHAYFGLESLSGVRWDDHVHPADVKTGRRIYQTAIRSLHTFEAQQRLFAADGRVHWFRVAATPILDDTGQVMGWFGSAVDIDEWRRAADEMTDREEMLHRFYESEETLMWVGEAETREIVALNPDCADAWSLPAGQGSITWDTWVQFAHPDDRPQLSMLFDKAAAGEVAQTRFRSAPTADRMRRYHVTAFAMPGLPRGRRRVGGMVVEVPSADDPRIYLIDPRQGCRNAMAHGLTRKGLRVRTFEDAAEFHRMASDLAPGCVVMAVRDDIEPTVKLAAALRRDRRLPWIAFGDLTGRLEDVVQLMKLGAADILNTPDPDAVAAAGYAALAVTFGKVAENPANGAQHKIDQLSPRERQVLDGLVAGGTNKSIAKDLDLSPRTVETHRARLMDRLDVSTLADLIKLAAGGSPD